VTGVRPTSVQTVRDRFDAVTIGQLVANALARGASFLLIPAGARLAQAQTRLTHDLESHGAVCVAISQSRLPTAPQHACRPVGPPRQRQAVLA
jgi:hypothetical protein